MADLASVLACVLAPGGTAWSSDTEILPVGIARFSHGAESHDGHDVAARSPVAIAVDQVEGDTGNSPRRLTDDRQPDPTAGGQG